jgi:hypothetical protein
MRLEIISRASSFIRALNNFDMVRIYSQNSTQSTDAKALGMYYLDVVDPFTKPSDLLLKIPIKVLWFSSAYASKIGTNTNTLGKETSKAAVLLCYLCIFI